MSLLSVRAYATLFSGSLCLSLTHSRAPSFFLFLFNSFVTICNHLRSVKRKTRTRCKHELALHYPIVTRTGLFFFVVVPLSSYLFFSFLFMNLFSGAVRGGYLLPRLFFYWRCGFKEEKHPIKLLIQLLSRGYAARERERPCKAGKQGRGLSSSSNGLSRVVYSNSGI